MRLKSMIHSDHRSVKRSKTCAIAPERTDPCPAIGRGMRLSKANPLAFSMTKLLTCVFMSLFLHRAAACDPGLWDNGGCEPCPAGWKCDGPSNGKVQCASNEYATAGSTTCTACPVGYRCPSRDAKPIACTNSQYSPSGTTTCSTLSSNQVSTDRATAVTCGQDQANNAEYVDSSR